MRRKPLGGPWAAKRRVALPTDDCQVGDPTRGRPHLRLADARLEDQGLGSLSGRKADAVQSSSLRP